MRNGRLQRAAENESEKRKGKEREKSICEDCELCPCPFILSQRPLVTVPAAGQEASDTIDLIERTWLRARGLYLFDIGEIHRLPRELLPRPEITRAIASVRERNTYHRVEMPGGLLENSIQTNIQ